MSKRPLSERQVPTIPVTIEEIMSDARFARGVADVRAGRGYPADYDVWSNKDKRWAYERGRQWARLTPRNVPLKINGRLNLKAVMYYRDDII